MLFLAYPCNFFFLNELNMAVDEKRSRLAFQRLGRELTRIARKPAPESIHKFRTNSRRVEALLTDVVLELDRNDEKLLKLLARLRKRAGKVRDLDVQLAALRDLKIAQGNGHKAQLLEVLIEERGERERKLGKAFNREIASQIRKRLKRAAGRLTIPKNTEPLALTLSKLAQLNRDHAPLTEKTLHEYRIIGKRARYIAELADDDPAAKRVIEQLKHMQDVLGDWHDWLKLTQRAEQLLGSVRDSALVSMLRNVTQAKFRQSLDAVAEIRSVFAGKELRARSTPALTRKSIAREPSRAAVA